MYKNDKYAFAVQYPDGWNIREIPGDGPIVHFLDGMRNKAWDTHVYIDAIEWYDNNTWSDVQEREYQIDYVKNRQVQFGKDAWTDSDYAEKNHSLDANPERYPNQDPEDYAREHNQINQTTADACGQGRAGNGDH